MLRRRLGAELRRLRERAGHTGAEVADELGWSPSKLSRVESGRSTVRPDDLNLLLDHYQVADPAQRRELTDMVDQAGIRAWWEQHRLTEGLRAYLDLESVAIALDIFHPQLVPGLLQTAEYARAVHQGARAPTDETEETIRTRLARQQILARDRPPRVRALVDEAVLRRPVGGRAVMRRQVRRLVELGEGPAVELRVLPLSAGEYACMAGSFIIVTVPDPAAPEGGVDSVYTEGMTGGLVRTLTPQVAVYRHSFEIDWRAALSAEASAVLLRALVDEYGKSD
jgi:transcriptional regulator with XRE-family HTH domain